MKNEERFSEPKERVEAFERWCKEKSRAKQCPGECPVQTFCQLSRISAFAYWLHLEYDAGEPLECPYCGGTCVTWGPMPDYDNAWEVHCICGCGYHSQKYKNQHEAVDRHNQIVRAVRDRDEEVRLKHAECEGEK